MTSKASMFESRYEEMILQNQSNFLSEGDSIVDIVFLNNTILNDPKVQRLGIALNQTFEIQPRAIFTTKGVDNLDDFGIVESSSKAVGLIDIGILHAYAKMVNPKYAVFICEKSFSKELSYLLTDPVIAPKLLNYGQNRSIQFLDHKS
jgi:hypothetical protein